MTVNVNKKLPLCLANVQPGTISYDIAFFSLFMLHFYLYTAL